MNQKVSTPAGNSAISGWIYRMNSYGLAAMNDSRIDSTRLLDTTRRLIAGTQAGGIDWIGVACMVVLGVTGIFFIYSAQAFVGGSHWMRQILWLVIGGGVCFAVSRLDYKIFLENAHWLYLGALVLLALLWTPLGVEREGARRWLNLQLLAYQPSEAAKVSTLVMVASILARSELGSLRESLWVLLKVFIVTIIPMILIFVQPDLGSCLIIPPMVLSLLYVSRLSERFFVVVFGLVVLLAAIVGADLFRYAQFLETEQLTAHEARGQFEERSFMPLLKDYQRERIMTFVAPEVVDPGGTGAAWNAKQAQQAVGTGGLTGKGWTQGLQAMLGYLPRSVAHNDFIFAVLAEETGFVGGILIISVFTVLLANGIRVASVARDRFGTLLAVGVTVIFLIHVFVNIGMSIGLTPITGLPLPFVSYGGSFILSCSILMGIVQSVHRHRRAFA